MSLGESGYDKDRFDRRNRGRLVGVHRSPAKPRRRWRTLVIFLAMTLGLFGIGVAVVEMSRYTPEPVTEPTPSAEPIVTDPAMIDPASGTTISVLDATDGAGQTATETLEAGGWPVLGTLEADPQPTSVVFYNDESLAPIARGVGQLLGIETIQLEASELSPSPITVVVGADSVSGG